MKKAYNWWDEGRKSGPIGPMNSECDEAPSREKKESANSVRFEASIIGHDKHLTCICIVIMQNRLHYFIQPAYFLLQIDLVKPKFLQDSSELIAEHGRTRQGFYLTSSAKGISDNLKMPMATSGSVQDGPLLLSTTVSESTLTEPSPKNVTDLMMDDTLVSLTSNMSEVSHIRQEFIDCRHKVDKLFGSMPSSPMHEGITKDCCNPL